jgi:hypothetical protein
MVVIFESQNSLRPLWARLALSGPASPSLGPPRPLWARLALSGPASPSLGPPRPLWARLALSGPASPSWARLALSGPLWVRPPRWGRLALSGPASPSLCLLLVAPSGPPWPVSRLRARPLLARPRLRCSWLAFACLARFPVLRPWPSLSRPSGPFLPFLGRLLFPRFVVFGLLRLACSRDALAVLGSPLRVRASRLAA